MFFLFNRTTLQVFVTYLTGALCVHPLWFYKHKHDNRVRSKLFVACQRWWFEWQFWFVPSVPGYLREEEELKTDPWCNPTDRNHVGLYLENEMAVVKIPTSISNNPVFTTLFFNSELWWIISTFGSFNPLNAELNPICHLLALLGARHILHISRIRVKAVVYFSK